MKRLLLLPLVLIACTPAASYPVEVLPLRTGQVWRYTLLEDGKEPRSYDITVEDVPLPAERGFLSKPYTPGPISMTTETLLMAYGPQKRTMTATWDRGRERMFCFIQGVQNTQRAFKGVLTSNGVKVGVCTVTLIKMAW